ncbi:response regulator [Hoeflea sp.]|uniref:response regulator n=1 Tax=Hoeflea sp. TaxID=1940281 RepID=UPI0037483231
MTEVCLSEIHFLEDSDDEVFISQLLLKQEKICADLIHHSDFSSFSKSLEARKPDTVILAFVDLNLPGTKGTEIVSQVLEHFEKNVILGICSGSEDPEDIRLSFKSGAHFFANKPLGKIAIEAACRSVPELMLRENTDESIEIIYSVKQ